MAYWRCPPASLWQRKAMSDRFSVYLSRHLQVFFDTLGRLCSTPLATIMTVLVLAIAMTLPMVLYKIADSLARVTGDWAGAPRISVFIDAQSDGAEVDAVAIGRELLNNPHVEDVEYVSPDQGLAEFSSVSGMAEAIEALPSNPLPPLLVVVPARDLAQSRIAGLVASIEQRSDVDSVVYDQKWLNRIDAMVGVFRHGVMILSVLMGVGILLLIGNTVRLGITHRATEIEILDQVGATHSFIRRPFLYLGAIESLLGGFLAWFSANLTLYLLEQPVAELADLYQSDFAIGWVGPGLGLGVIGSAIILGIAAALVTVNQHLRYVRPR